MKTSILICATCFIVTGCSAQLIKFPSLSSALSSLTGFGSSSSSGGSGGSSSSSNSQAGPSSPYSGLVRDYGRNLMMAMSNIYPTLFKPPQSQQQQQQQSQPAPQSPYDQAFSASQYGSQSLFPSQSAPAFSFGGSTFSISPSLPFSSIGGGSQSPQGAPTGSHSPFSASFGSSINSPSSFGPLSSAPFLQQSMPSYAPASSYNAAFEAANGAGPSVGGPSFGGLSSTPGIHSAGSSLSNQALLSQSTNSNPISSYSSIPNFNGPSAHDSAAAMSQQHQTQQAPMNQQSQLGSHSSVPFGGQQQHQQGNQFASQQYRPDMMSIAASAPVPSSNSYSNYGNIPSSQQAPASPSSYQQPSYR